MLRDWLTHPLARGVDIDSSQAALVRRRIVEEKRFLQRIYQEWYDLLVAALPDPTLGPVLELGSGGCYLDPSIPGLITSDIVYLPDVWTVVDAQTLPFKESALRGIIAINVFHHLPEPRSFLANATRCLVPKGVIAMVEPWVSHWSSWVYSRLHHEPFLPGADEWEAPSNGPLSGANGALPWIVFQRDRRRLELEFPQLEIVRVMPFMPFRYLLSGGVSMRSLSPQCSFAAWRWIERVLQPWMEELAMFACIVVRKRA